MDGARAAFDTAVDPGPEAARPVHHGPVHHGNSPKSDRSRTPAGPLTARTAPAQVFRRVIRDRFGSKKTTPSLKVLNGPGPDPVGHAAAPAGDPGTCKAALCAVPSGRGLAAASVRLRRSRTARSPATDSSGPGFRDRQARRYLGASTFARPRSRHGRASDRQGPGGAPHSS